MTPAFAAAADSNGNQSEEIFFVQANQVAAEMAGVYSLPEVYYRVDALLDDQNTTNDQLAELIEFDVGLTARLLRVVNSAYFGRPARIDRISTAVGMMGRLALRDLLLATVTIEAFSGLSTRLIDMSTFWFHSVYAGVIARQLAARCQVLHPERLFVAGMLHDLGSMAIYQVCPTEAQQVLTTAPHTDGGVYERERDILGFTHADVGAALFTAWNLPASLIATTAYHHEPYQADDYALETSLVHIANSFTNSIEAGRYIAECQAQVSTAALTITGLDAEIKDEILATAEPRMAEVFYAVAPGSVIM